MEIERDLGLHPLAVEDAVLARDRPKLDVYDGTHFVTLITVDQREQGPSDRGRIMAFVGDSFVVTVRQEHGDTLARARRRLEQVPSRGIAGLDVLHAVLDTVVDDWTSASRRVEASILASAIDSSRRMAVMRPIRCTGRRLTCSPWPTPSSRSSSRCAT